jgi:anti-sigma factor RsiW
MKCSKIKKKLSAYLDGEMPEQEMQMISEHVEHCEECKAGLAAFIAVSDALNTIESIEVPLYFMTRLRQNARAQTKPVSFLQRIRGLVLSGAIAAAVFASLFIGNQAGKNLYQSIAQTTESLTAETTDVFGLSAFEEFPGGSLSDIYYELVTGGNSG